MMSKKRLVREKILAKAEKLEPGKKKGMWRPTKPLLPQRSPGE
jgi:hypothetical protein